MREHTKIYILYDAHNIDEFKDLLKRRKLDVAGCVYRRHFEVDEPTERIISRLGHFQQASF